MTNNRKYTNFIQLLPTLSLGLLFVLLFNISFGQGNCAAKIGALPSIPFKSKSVKLLPDAQQILEVVASKLRENPTCGLVVKSYCSSNKKEQQRSWDLANSVINNLVEKQGISIDRFIFSYGNEGGDCNMVDLIVAAEGEEGPNSVPPPHPSFRKQN